MEQTKAQRLGATRQRRAGRRPSWASRALSRLLRAIPSPLQHGAKVRGRLEGLRGQYTFAPGERDLP